MEPGSGPSRRSVRSLHAGMKKRIFRRRRISLPAVRPGRTPRSGRGLRFGRRRFPRFPALGFRTFLVLVLGLVMAGVAWRFGINAGEDPGPPPPIAASPTPTLPGSPADLAVGPKEIRAQLDRLLRLRAPVRCAAGRLPYVALTFDDGPSARTSEILRILAERGTPATFFLVGRRVAPRDPQIARMGPLTEVGNHTWSHASMRALKAKARRAEIRRTQDVLQEQTGAPVRLFRPPFGHRDGRLERMLARFGLVDVLWSVNAGDDIVRTTMGRMLRTIEREVRPGAIILMHERVETVRALPRVLDLLAERGLRAVSVPELLALDPPTKDQLRRGHCLTAEGFTKPELGGGRP